MPVAGLSQDGGGLLEVAWLSSWHGMEIWDFGDGGGQSAAAPGLAEREVPPRSGTMFLRVQSTMLVGSQAV